MAGELTLQSRLLVLGAGIALWLAQYFIINNLPRRHIPETWSLRGADQRLPVQPSFIFIYLSTYVFVLLPFFLVSDASLLFKIVLGYLGITVISSAIHVAYPSRIDRLDPGQHVGLSWVLIDWFQRICKPYDNCPSTHVGYSALAVMTGFLVGGPITGGVFLTWAALIAWSTLATRQHTILDVAAGGAIGTGMAFAVLFL